jgi:hypothetical protein
VYRNNPTRLLLRLQLQLTTWRNKQYINNTRNPLLHFQQSNPKADVVLHRRCNHMGITVMAHHSRRIMAIAPLHCKIMASVLLHLATTIPDHIAAVFKADHSSRCQDHQRPQLHQLEQIRLSGHYSRLLINLVKSNIAVFKLQAANEM